MPKSGLIVAVCTANICRSPMAAGLLRHALAGQPEPLRSVRVESAGVSARMGEPVTENSVFALKKVGLDISKHFSQPLTQKLVNEADLILAMTESHRALIQLHFKSPADKVYLFREFMDGDVEREIEDPYGQSIKAYESARDCLVEAVPNLIAHLKKFYAE